MTILEKIEQEINKINERNRRVEGEKAWETSWSRKIVIAAVTYIAVSLFLYYIHYDQPFIGGIIPTIGFILSTLSVSFLKKFWLKYIYKK